MNKTAARTHADDRPSAAAGDVFSPGRFALILAGLILLAFWRVILGLETFAVRDFGIFSYPVASFQRQCFWRGELPWWNPLNCCGLPFLAQFNTLALYPLALIYLVPPLTWGLPVFCLAHLFLGGLGMYYLATRWTGSSAAAALAGIVFAFNGLSLNFLMWPSHIATFAWMPWVIYLTERGWRRGGSALVPAALAAAMEVLGGGPETILFTWLILAGLATGDAARRATPAGPLFCRFAGMGLLALAFSAPQWLPTADFALHCSRNTSYANSAWSMPAWGWANFLVPLFRTSPWQGPAMQQGQYWTTSYYVGIGTIFLAAVGVWRTRDGRVWLLAGIVLASLILALGDHALVFPWLHRWLPFLGFFRFPIKFVIVSSALLPLLAAVGLNALEKDRAWRPSASLVVVVITIFLGLVYFAAPESRANALSRAACFAAFSVAAGLFVTRTQYRAWTAMALLACTWLDLTTAVPWQNPGLHPSVYQPGLGLMSANLRPVPDPAESRVMMSSFAAYQLYYHPSSDLKTAYLLDRSVFLADCNLLDNVPKVDGFFSLYLRDPDKILWQLDDRSGAELAHLEAILGVSQTIAPGKLYAWMPRTNYVPIVTAGQEPRFASDPTAFAALTQTNVDFRLTTYLPVEIKSQVTARAQPAAHIVHKQFSPAREVIEVTSPAPALVNISQAYSHNWRAQVDGRPVAIWRANFAFQAVQIPAGHHTLVLTYREQTFVFGLVLTVVAGGACAALIFADKVFRQKPDITT
jgi:hypothetical protein